VLVDELLRKMKGEKKRKEGVIKKKGVQYCRTSAALLFSVYSPNTERGFYSKDWCDYIHVLPNVNAFDGLKYMIETTKQHSRESTSRNTYTSHQ
jgi:hypothetical protein